MAYIEPILWPILLTTIGWAVACVSYIAIFETSPWVSLGVINAIVR